MGLQNTDTIFIKTLYNSESNAHPEKKAPESKVFFFFYPGN